MLPTRKKRCWGSDLKIVFEKSRGVTVTSINGVWGWTCQTLVLYKDPKSRWQKGPRAAGAAHHHHHLVVRQPSCNTCSYIIFVGGPGCFLSLLSIFNPGGLWGLLFLFIMQIEFSLMGDNISLVRDSGLHKGWSIRWTEKADFQRRQAVDWRTSSYWRLRFNLHISPHRQDHSARFAQGTRSRIWTYTFHLAGFRLPCVLISKKDGWLHPE